MMTNKMRRNIELAEQEVGSRKRPLVGDEREARTSMVYSANLLRL